MDIMMKKIKSKIKTPLAKRARAIIMGNDAEKVNLLVTGYLKKHLMNHQYIPDYVVGILISFFGREMLHIIQGTGKHFSISVDVILKDCYH